MTLITSLPSDIILDNIIPLLSVKEFLHLSETCKAFHSFAYDEVYWRKLTTSTFRLPAQPLREKGWRELYKNLSSATLYTWGSNGQGRIGHDEDCRRMPYPMEVELPVNQVAVDVVMGGWSTTALTASGSLYTWGTLNGSWNSSGSMKPAERSTQLQFPPPYSSTKIIEVSSGRSHVLGLSEEGRIWTWGDKTDPGNIIKFINVDTETYMSGYSGTLRAYGTVEKVVAGWGHDTALINGVGIVVWFPNSEVDPGNTEIEVDGEVVPGTCYIEGTSKPPGISSEDWDYAKEVGEVIGIMAGDTYLIFLTKLGKIYAVDAQPNLIAGIRPVQLHKFSAPKGEKPMSYISGSFRNFAVFNSDGLVYIGSKDLLKRTFEPSMGISEDEEALDPIIMPSLQKRDIVAIAFADYHSLALTSQGQVLAWGTESESCGCLGLGPPEVARKKGVRSDKLEKPTEVRFDWFESNTQKATDGKYFVFNISAAGWHSCALALAPNSEWREQTRNSRLQVAYGEKPVHLFGLGFNRPTSNPGPSRAPFQNPNHPRFQGQNHPPQPPPRQIGRVPGRPPGEASHGGRVRPGEESVHNRNVGDIITSNPSPFISHGPVMPLPGAFPTPTCAANGAGERQIIGEENRRRFEEHLARQRDQAAQDRSRFERDQQQRNQQGLFPTPTCAANGVGEGQVNGEENRRRFEEHLERQRDQAAQDRGRFERDQQERNQQESNRSRRGEGSGNRGREAQSNSEEHRRRFEEHLERQREQAAEDRIRFTRDQQKSDQ